MKELSECHFVTVTIEYLICSRSSVDLNRYVFRSRITTPDPSSIGNSRKPFREILKRSYHLEPRFSRMSGLTIDVQRTPAPPQAEHVHQRSGLNVTREPEPRQRGQSIRLDEECRVASRILERTRPRYMYSAISSRGHRRVWHS